MRSRIMRRGAVLSAAAAATLGLAAASAPASLLGLPPGGQVNESGDAGASDVVGGSLAPGGVRVPWATFEQKDPGAEQQIFVRAFKGGQWVTQGSPASLNIDPHQEAEAPSIDFAGADRTVPWVSWYEPNPLLGGSATNIFASRFDAPNKKWIPEGQDRAPSNKLPSLNIHVDRDAENPAVVGGAAVAGNAPVPWVAWQERDGGADNDHSPNQIFASRAIKQTDCSTNKPGGGTSVGAFCWQQTGIDRTTKGAATSTGATDPTLNIDPTRDGIEPDFAFTGPSDTVPWVVWYEQNGSQIGLRNTEQVFAAKAVAEPIADGGVKYVAVGRGTAGKVNTLDTSGTHGFGACAVDQASEDACSLNVAADRDAEDPRVAAGTLTPGGITAPWVAWSEALPNGNHGVFVSRLVGGDHFELANNGNPVSAPTLDASRPDIAFSGNTPYVQWHSSIGGKLKTVVGHFEGLTTFKVDAALDPADADVRSPISSSNTADPFTADGANAPGGAIGTPFVLHTAEGSPQRLLAHGYAPTDVVTGDASDVTLSSAHVTGSVNPAGAAVKAHFDYGQTPSYGSRTADQKIGVATTPQSFGADLGALPEYNVIHYRAVVDSDFGTFYGPDRTFVTGVRPPGPVSNPGHGHKPPKHHKRHWPRINNKVLKLRSDGTVVVSMTCPASHGKVCKGTLKITYNKHVIGRKAFSLKANRTKAITVKLSGKDNPRLASVTRRAHSTKVKVTAGTSSTTLRLVRA